MPMINQSHTKLLIEEQLSTRRRFIKSAAAVAASSMVAPSILFANRKTTIKPFVKWVGGKGQLIEQLDVLLPKDFAA